MRVSVPPLVVITANVRSLLAVRVVVPVPTLLEVVTPSIESIVSEPLLEITTLPLVVF